MPHRKAKYSIPVGGQVVCGSRKLRLDAVDGDVADVTLTVKKGETVEIKDPRQRDNPWIIDDPGEGEMVESKHAITIRLTKTVRNQGETVERAIPGHKIRIGNYRQFRVFPVDETGQHPVVVVGPESETVQ